MGNAFPFAALPVAGGASRERDRAVNPNPRLLRTRYRSVRRYVASHTHSNHKAWDVAQLCPSHAPAQAHPARMAGGVPWLSGYNGSTHRHDGMHPVSLAAQRALL